MPKTANKLENLYQESDLVTCVHTLREKYYCNETNHKTVFKGPVGIQRLKSYLQWKQLHEIHAAFWASASTRHIH